MGLRRFTRLTKAHSKKVENHGAALAIYFLHYNFARPREAVRTKRDNRRSPAMATGVAAPAVDRRGGGSATGDAGARRGLHRVAEVGGA
jgi:hypothetical protein